jgi:hypothetical protein
MLNAFLDFGGYTTTSAIEAARENRHAMHETVKAFIGSLPDDWAQRAFAYSGLRAFFSRCRIYLPTDPSYEVGGRREEWWL